MPNKNSKTPTISQCNKLSKYLVCGPLVGRPFETKRFSINDQDLIPHK